MESITRKTTLGIIAFISAVMVSCILALGTSNQAYAAMSEIGDAPHSYDGSQFYQFGETLNGQVAKNNQFWDEDCYYFTISKKTKVKFYFKHNTIGQPENWFNLTMKNGADAPYFYKGNYLAGSKASATYDMGTLPAGSYKITIVQFGKCPDQGYSFRVYQNPVPDKTSITSLKSGKKKATLKWKKSADATGYQVYMKKQGGSYKKVKTVNSKNTVKFVKKSLKKGKTYYFKVRAINKVGGKTYTSGFSSARSVRISK